MHAFGPRDFSHHGWAIPPSPGPPRWLQGATRSPGNTGYLFPLGTHVCSDGETAGDKLYIGTSTGTVQMYTLGDEPGSSSKPPPLSTRTRGVLLDDTGNAKLTKTITVSKKPVEQLGYLKDVNSLVVLSGPSVSFLGSTLIEPTIDASVALYPIPDLQPQSPLSKAKAAFSFAIHTSVQHIPPPGKLPTISVPTVVSYLLVACRRKLVIYSWKDGEPQEVQVRSTMSTLLSKLKLCRKLPYHTHPERCPL